MEFKLKDTKIIILSGKAGSGKSTIASIISKHKKCIILSYALYIKQIAKNVLLWDGNEDDKPRDFLQQFGDVIKSIDSNLLVNRMVEDIKMYSYFYDLIVISDARFINEIETIKNNFKNAYSVRVCGNNNNLTKEQKNHITEVALDNYDKYDYIIKNDENIEEKIINMLGEIL